MTQYDDLFFDYVDAGALRSARVFTRLLMPEIRISSMADIGCGRGGWAAVWKEAGCPRAVGVDGDYVERETLKIPLEDFHAQDLDRPFDLGERFDLVQSLEVAEHLKPESSGDFVSTLTRHGNVVLFSAAVPGQGGTSHINERPLQFWRELFARHGFQAYDFVRPRVRDNHDVEPWYRYNTVVYASREGAGRLSPAVLAARVPEDQKLSEGGALSWRLRRAVVRFLPRPVVNRLAVLNAAVKANGKRRFA